MIELKNVYKTYNKGASKVEALGGVTLTINRGDLVALAGPSGSGKSTLLGLIGGLDAPSSGSILIDNEDISSFDAQRLAAYRRDKVGFVFQQFNLIPTLSVIENVMLPLFPVRTKKADKYAAARDILAKVGLQERENHLPGELSGGEQQRVAIARALVNTPHIILADEPTGDLDWETGKAVMALLTNQSTRDGRTVIIATHDEEVMAVAERVIVLRDGSIVTDERRVKNADKKEE